MFTMLPRKHRAQTRINLTTASDQVLLELTRDGISEAFGELWSRHSGAALAAARAFTGYDPDDLAQDAFLKVYTSVKTGGNIPVSFRAYIATTVRNLARDTGRRQPSTPVHSLDEQHDDSSLSTDDFSDKVLESNTTVQAFTALPVKQRELLWYRDVEDLAVNEVARYVGMTPNTTTIAIKRAREAFKNAWITAHLSPTQNLPADCAAVVNKIALHTREKLSATATAQIDLHLLDCERCKAIASEANNLHKQLALAILPILLLGSAPTYLIWIQSQNNRTPIPHAAQYAETTPTSVRHLATRNIPSAVNRATPSRTLIAAAATASLLAVGATILPSIQTANQTVPTITTQQPSEKTTKQGESAVSTEEDTPDANADILRANEDSQAETDRSFPAPAYSAITPVQTTRPDLPLPSNTLLTEEQAHPPTAIPTSEPPLTPSPVAQPVSYPAYQELSVSIDSLNGIISINATPGATVEILIVMTRSMAYRETLIADSSGHLTYGFPNHRGKNVSFNVHQSYETAEGIVQEPASNPLTDLFVPSHNL